jgi:hypothetical protein
MRHRSPRESQIRTSATWRLAALAAGLALAVIARPAAAEPVAFAVDLKGAVTVTSAQGGKPQRVALGRGLERGDKIVVGPGSRMTMFFDGNVIELGEKSTMTVGGRMGSSAGTTAKSELPSEVFARVKRFVSSDSRKSGMMAVAPLRGGGDTPQPMLLTPRRTSVRETRPAFAWRAVEGATRYQVTVSGDQGDVWSREATGTSLDYPADAAALSAGGDYTCAIRALSDAGPIASDTETFSVLADAEAKQVDGELADLAKATGTASTSASLYLAGSYLAGRGLYGEAARRFEDLCKVTPDAPGPHEALGNVYRTIGLTEQAAGEFQRALELSRAQ